MGCPFQARAHRRGGTDPRLLGQHQPPPPRPRRQPPAWCPDTAAYLARKQAEGKTRKEALRSLKRHLARRVWALLTARQCRAQLSPANGLQRVGPAASPRNNALATPTGASPAEARLPAATRRRARAAPSRTTSTTKPRLTGGPSTGKERHRSSGAGAPSAPADDSLSLQTTPFRAKRRRCPAATRTGE
jgi:hypothetical protein